VLVGCHLRSPTSAVDDRWVDKKKKQAISQRGCGASRAGSFDAITINGEHELPPHDQEEEEGRPWKYHTRQQKIKKEEGN